MSLRTKILTNMGWPGFVVWLL